MVPAKRVVAEARSVWEMECLVQALDSMETMSSFMELINEYDQKLIAAQAWTTLTLCLSVGNQLVATESFTLRWVKLSSLSRRTRSHCFGIGFWSARKVRVSRNLRL